MYEKARIYRLVGGGKTYYGSTCIALVRRKTYHRNAFKCYENGKGHYLTAFEVIKEPDWDIVLVEEYPCSSKEQLHARERWWIENNECVNKFIPARTPTEWEREYRNKEGVKEQKKKNNKKWYDKKKAMKEQEHSSH